MKTDLKLFFKENKTDIFIFGLIGAVVYLASKNFLPVEMSTLQSSFGTGVLNKVVNLEIQTLLLFIIFGIAIGLILSTIIRKK